MADRSNTTSIPIIDPNPPRDGTYSWVPYVGVVAALTLIIVIIYTVYRFRHRARYDYAALQEIEDMPNRLLQQRKIAIDHARDEALLKCSFYLRSSGQYILLDHLTDVGCRPQKNWFLVKQLSDSSTKMLTMMPRSDAMVLPFKQETCKTLQELFDLLKHPYIQPIDAIDFQQDKEEVVIVQPFSNLGSLKDIIHGVRCVESWDYKYCYHGVGLQTFNIQKYGKQILEGMLFLQSKGMPPCGHLHSGNIIIEKETCRISAYENALLGYNNRMFNFMKKLLKRNADAFDTLCFGHLMFELATGRMLDSPLPNADHFKDVNDEQVLELIQFIFQSDDYPSIKEIIKHKFFSGIELPNIEVTKVKKSIEVKSLLKSVKRGKLTKSKAKSKSSSGTMETQREEQNIFEPRKGRKHPLEVETPDVFSFPDTPIAPLTQKKSSTSAKSSKASSSKASSSKAKPASESSEATPLAASIPSSSNERSALLEQIRSGMKLRRTSMDPNC